MRCENCSTDNSAGAKFCIRCAHPFKLKCPKCLSDNPAEASFCSQCGTALGKAEPLTARSRSIRERISQATESLEPPSVDGERKTISALFADIKGSTELEQ